MHHMRVMRYFEHHVTESVRCFDIKSLSIMSRKSGLYLCIATGGGLSH